MYVIHVCIALICFVLFSSLYIHVCNGQKFPMINLSNSSAEGDNTLEEREQKQLERAKKRALNSSMIQELKEEYLDTPIDVAHDSAFRMERSKQYKARQEWVPREWGAAGSGKEIGTDAVFRFRFQVRRKLLHSITGHEGGASQVQEGDDVGHAGKRTDSVRRPDSLRTWSFCRTEQAQAQTFERKAQKEWVPHNRCPPHPPPLTARLT